MSEEPLRSVGVIGLGPNKNGDAFSSAAIEGLANKLIGTEVKDQDGNPTGRIIAASGAEGRDRLRVTIEHLNRSHTDAIVMLEDPNIPKFSVADHIDVLTREVENIKPIKPAIMNTPETPIIPPRLSRPRGIGLLGLLAGSLGIPLPNIPRPPKPEREKSPEEVATALRVSDDHRRVSRERRFSYNLRRSEREFKAGVNNRAWTGQPNMKAHIDALRQAATVGVPLNA